MLEHDSMSLTKIIEQIFLLQLSFVHLLLNLLLVVFKCSILSFFSQSFFNGLQYFSTFLYIIFFFLLIQIDFQILPTVLLRLFFKFLKNFVLIILISSTYLTTFSTLLYSMYFFFWFFLSLFPRGVYSNADNYINYCC